MTHIPHTVSKLSVTRKKIANVSKFIIVEMKWRIMTKMNTSSGQLRPYPYIYQTNVTIYNPTVTVNIKEGKNENELWFYDFFFYLSTSSTW